MEASGFANQFSWPKAAACVDADWNMFFPGPDQSAAPAIRLCQACPVRERCLKYALSIGEVFGIWGGVTASGRRRLLRLSA